MIRDLLLLTLAVALAFFLLTGAGIFSAWFWLTVFT